MLDEGGHIFRPPAVISCDNDGQAIDYAEALSGGQLLEVWEKDRRVGRIEPTGPGSASMISTEPEPAKDQIGTIVKSGMSFEEGGDAALG